MCIHVYVDVYVGDAVNMMLDDSVSRCCPSNPVSSSEFYPYNSAVMGKILLLKYLKYFTKYSGKKVFKIVF